MDDGCDTASDAIGTVTCEHPRRRCSKPVASVVGAGEVREEGAEAEGGEEKCNLDTMVA